MLQAGVTLGDSSGHPPPVHVGACICAHVCTCVLEARGEPQVLFFRSFFFPFFFKSQSLSLSWSFTVSLVWPACEPPLYWGGTRDYKGVPPHP